MIPVVVAMLVLLVGMVVIGRRDWAARLERERWARVKATPEWAELSAGFQRVATVMREQLVPAFASMAPAMRKMAEAFQAFAAAFPPETRSQRWQRRLSFWRR